MYKKEFGYYFNELHGILLSILVNFQIPNSDEKELKLKNLLCRSLMKWKSKYSFEILKNINEAMESMVLDVRANISSIKVIVENGLLFLD